MKFPVLWYGLCCFTEGWYGKCSEILARMKLLYNPRVNKIFTHSVSHSLTGYMKFKTLKLLAVRLQPSVGKNGKKNDNLEYLQKVNVTRVSRTKRSGIELLLTSVFISSYFYILLGIFFCNLNWVILA